MDSLENKDALAAQEQVENLVEAQPEQNEVKETVVDNDAQVEEQEPKQEPQEAPEAQAPEQEETTADEASTIEKIVEDFRQLLNEPLEDIKDKAEQLKNQFYKIQHSLRTEAANADDADLSESSEDNTDADEQAPDNTTDNSLENTFRQLLNQYKEKKAQAHQQAEAQMKQNLLRKENIIEQMKQMTEQGTADVQENLKTFKELQAEWKTIGAVPPESATNIWKQYNLYQEKFYDLVKINFELRDYDLKKNLDLKNQLIAQAEQLKNNENVVEAFRQLQQLHEQWAEIGPVARELREETWNRFKEASTIINKRHQDYFEQLHKREEENLQRKLNIIDQIKVIDTDEFTTSKQWDEAAEQINALQNEWRTIGFAPKKHNQLIYDEYRKLCDEFFRKRTAFYRQLKDTLSVNLQKKRSLVEQAESLKDSDNWKEATDMFVKMQQEWKQIGPVARKYSDDIWKRFQTACDTFFNRKKTQTQGQRSEEKQNLEDKRQVIAQIEAIDTTDHEQALSRLRELTAQFNQIGHVPFRDKDKVYKLFRAATDKVFDALDIQASERRLESFQRDVNLKDENTLQNDRRRLVRQYESLQQEIQTAENNILFFTSKSGKGNKLVDDLQKKINDLKRQLSDLEHKINIIDTKIEEE